MKADFDNLNDVIGKFVGTICLYNKKAVTIKEVATSPAPGDDKGNFTLIVCSAGGRNTKSVSLKDPAFNYKDFRLGYVNHTKGPGWWFRKPLKQYQQGLRGGQLDWIPTPHYYPDNAFSMTKPFISMLENTYPSCDAVEKALRDGEARALAFHRDFAVLWDNLHEDYILEYRGTSIGVATHRGLTSFRLVSEYRHLNEALQEVLAGV